MGVLFTVVLLALVLCLAGCGQKGEKTGVTEPEETQGQASSQAEETETEPEPTEAPVTFELALITDGRTLETGNLNRTAWSGLVAFAEENGISHRYYRPAGTEMEDYAASIDEAAAGGAGLIVCVGKEAKGAVLQKQTEYPKIDFLLVDGEPRGESGAVLESNALAARFQVDQGAYMAGYAAAVSGYRKFGFIGLRDDEKSRRYCCGLLQGLNDGIAQSAGMETEDSAELYFTYVDADVTKEEIKAKMISWSEKGISLMMAGTETLSSMCMAQSQSASMLVVGYGIDASERYTNLKASVMIDASESVREACEEYRDHEFAGGGISIYDVSTDSVGLKIYDASFVNFTTENFRQLKEQLASGDIQINNDITVRVSDMDFPFVKAVEENP